MTQENPQHFSVEADFGERSRLRFDPTINLGHLITFVGFLLAGFGAWSTLDKRVVVLEEGKKLQAAIDSAQDAQAARSSQAIAEGLLRLERQTERLADRVDLAIATRRTPKQEPAP